ncbi:MAG: hypothetical protein AAB556_00090 [Patescibacteria group bacterium]
MTSLKVGFGRGIPTAIVLSIVFGVISLGFSQFFKAACFLESLLVFTGLNPWVIKFVSYLIVLALIWFLGANSTAGIKWIFGKILKKKDERKFLFCVRIKSVLNGYPIGIVSKVYFDEKKKKVVYNVVFPNLGGMWTFIGVLAEDTERVEESAEDVLNTSFSAGFL